MEFMTKSNSFGNTRALANDIRQSPTEKFEKFYGHYRIPYLVVNEDRIEILGVFHGAMDIARYLK